MSIVAISALTALGAAPATGDLFVLVDISDTSMAGTGTDKKMTVANLFTAPTFTGLTTVVTLAASGLATLSGGLTVAAGNFTLTGYGGGTNIVGVGAVDSGGVGFRLLRVPN